MDNLSLNTLKLTNTDKIDNIVIIIAVSIHILVKMLAICNIKVKKPKPTKQTKDMSESILFFVIFSIMFKRKEPNK